MKNIMTFKEYADYEKVASKEKYRRNVSYYNPTEGWMLDLRRKNEESN